MNDIICDVENAIYVIEPKTTEVEITPTKEEQVVIPTDDMLYDKVTVKPIPDDYIIPSGEIELTENKNYDVTNKSIAKVRVKPNVGTKDITENGVYNASDDNLDGYSQVNVQTGGLYEYFSPYIEAGINGNKGGWINTLLKFRSPLTIKGTKVEYMFADYPLSEFPEIDTSELTSTSYMYAYCTQKQTIPNLNMSKVTDTNHMFYNSDVVINSLDTSNVINMNNMFANSSNTKTLPDFDTSKATNLSYIFAYMTKLVKSPNIDTSNAINVQSMYNQCFALIDIPELDFSKVDNSYWILYLSDHLKNLGGFKNFGKGFTTVREANSNYNALDIERASELTHESLMNIINKVYDIKSMGLNTQRIRIGTTNLAKLTSEEIAIATDKGWTVG